MSVRYIERFYNLYSRVYDQLFGRLSTSGLQIAPRLLELQAGTKLLEVGIGTGLSLSRLPTDIQLTGVDLSEKMLEKARKRARERGDRHVKLYKMDAHHLRFREASFDCVLAAYFISTVPDPVRVIGEIRRVCKPGGYILFLNHFQSDHRMMGFLDRVFSPLCYRVGFRSDLRLGQLMEEGGLRIETVEPIACGGYWKAVRCINPGPPEKGKSATPSKGRNSRSKRDSKGRPSARQSSARQSGTNKESGRGSAPRKRRSSKRRPRRSVTAHK